MIEPICVLVFSTCEDASLHLKSGHKDTQNEPEHGNFSSTTSFDSSTEMPLAEPLDWKVNRKLTCA